MATLLAACSSGADCARLTFPVCAGSIPTRNKSEMKQIEAISTDSGWRSCLRSTGTSQAAQYEGGDGGVAPRHQALGPQGCHHRGEGATSWSTSTGLRRSGTGRYSSQCISAGHRWTRRYQPTRGGSIIWNNAVASTAKKIRKERLQKNGVCFSDKCKTNNGGKKVKRRSSRLREKMTSRERFIRRIRPLEPTTNYNTTCM